MKIAVLIKQVPDTETKIKIANDRIDENGVKWVISPYDEYAVEEALRMKEAVGGEVVVVSMGPARCVEAMRQAMAMGADRGIHVDTASAEMDSFTTAIALAAAVRSENFDVILAGKQAVDDDCGQVAIGVAEKLGWAHVSPVEHIELQDGGKKLRVQRPIAGGKKQIIDLMTPAVLACDKGEHEPRYASLPGIMKAKSKPVATLQAATLLAGVQPVQQSVNVSLPPERKAGKVLKGEPQVVVKELVKLLREEAKVI